MQDMCDKHRINRHIVYRLLGTGPEADEEFEEKPDFLPMVPWYSGTSADMYKTVFDLLISVKLFLGRYDMRTMQVKHCFKCAILCASSNLPCSSRVLNVANFC